MVDANRLRVDEISLVARQALRREALELSNSCTLVARIAIHGGVRADQREPVHVLIDLLDRNAPTSHRMALLAIRSHLALVNISVTFRALRAHIRKHRLRMALRARNPFVHSTQWILGGVVIELRNSANRFPAAQRVTVLAGNAQASVGTARVGRRLRLRAGGDTAGQRSEDNRQIK